ncbi:MAG: PSD1 and planctomycete cytochrome C domain-containing protein [Pirellulales bacterium]|nr:PSD1 and planctomycete cytochrome C domain-containing protein [Pirellulales bacterium]
MAVVMLGCLVELCARADEAVDYNRDIRPILSRKCFECHGPDEQSRQAELRLDLADDREGPFTDRDEMPAIRPRDPEGSALWQRIVSEDPDQRMPPADSHKEPLSAAEQEMIRKWILEGAEFEEFWTFVPPREQTVPPVASVAWSSQRIDRFVMARLEREGFEPQPPADRRGLIRRVTFDLTGLPPTRQEVRNFLADRQPDAYERLVDRLIAKPQYGEHMAKYWLDLVRFADTNGIHHDHYREMTPYRDWVIRAFNKNLPFDQFLTYQLAGDLFADPSLDQLIASGYHRLHLVIDVGTALPEESFHRNVVDRVTAFGTTILGLTVQCAQCHDHKYDPITQRDFYQLYAFFNNLDAEPETPGVMPHLPILRVPTETQRARCDVMDAEINEAAASIAKIKKLLEKSQKPADALAGTSADQGPTVTAELDSAEKRHAQLIKDRKGFENYFPMTLVMKERSEIRPAHIHIRGAYDQMGEEVERDTPAFLPPLQSKGELKTRMDLARWATDSSNPLTARVATNRFWQQLFGVGLVKTSEDFGTQSEWPSHRELLDDLAYHFVASSWDVKALIKSIVMTETYRQSSHVAPQWYRTDPENRLLARGSRFRLDAEMIRDQILAVSGLLVPEMFGKSVKPPQPPNLWKTVSMVSSSTYSFVADEGDKTRRRSIYSFWKRAMPPPQLTIFDAPTRERCIARRERTNTPLQALVLMNEQQYFIAAQHLARDLLADSNATDRQRIARAYESITSRLADKSELATLWEGLEALRAEYEADRSLAKALIADLPSVADEDAVELAAYTMLINTLFNLDIVKTRE